MMATFLKSSTAVQNPSDPKENGYVKGLRKLRSPG